MVSTTPPPSPADASTPMPRRRIPAHYVTAEPRSPWPHARVAISVGLATLIVAATLWALMTAVAPRRPPLPPPGRATTAAPAPTTTHAGEAAGARPAPPAR
jgi:hypothetical protein